jgi:hypothetical protein
MNDGGERDWRAFGYGIVLRVAAAPSLLKLEHLLQIHSDNLVGYRKWSPEKYDQLMVLVAESRAELSAKERAEREAHDT